MNELKYGEDGWVWWPRPDKEPSDRETVLGEFVDILHFLLLGYNQTNDIPKLYHQAHLDEARNTTAPAREVATAELSVEIIRAANMKRYHSALVHWGLMAKALGFTETEIHDGYQKSVQKNLRRWNN